MDQNLSKSEAVAKEVDLIDDTVMLERFSKQRHNSLLQRMFVAKQNVTLLRQFFLPKQKLVTFLATRPVEYISPNVQVLLRDVQDHMLMSMDRLEYARETLNQSHTNYSMEKIDNS